MSLLLLARSAFSQEPPTLVVAADGAEQAAARVERFDVARLRPTMRLVGVTDPGDAIRVLAVSDRSPLAERTPDWITGYAYGALSEVVLFADRVPQYPASSLDELIVHEVCHVLIDRAAGFRPVPRWFHEGLALTAARPWNLGDRTRVSLALLFGPRAALSDVEQAFGGDRRDIERAYAVSGAFVRHLLDEGGPGAAAEVLDGVRQGLPFESAFRRATGVSLAAAESHFWDRTSFFYRWLPILTSSVTLWLGITALALAAFWRRRQRDRALLERWELEEAAAAVIVDDASDIDDDVAIH